MLKRHPLTPKHNAKMIKKQIYKLQTSKVYLSRLNFSAICPFWERNLGLRITLAWYWFNVLLILMIFNLQKAEKLETTNSLLVVKGPWLFTQLRHYTMQGIFAKTIKIWTFNVTWITLMACSAGWPPQSFFVEMETGRPEWYHCGTEWGTSKPCLSRWVFFIPVVVTCPSSIGIWWAG